MHAPWLLSGIAEAVERLLAARVGGERIALVGDYDVDGITATALLSAVFRTCGLDSTAILPHRIRDGYGFQPQQVAEAVARGCRLIVTVDCGTTAFDAVAAARAAGLAVVVTDHHLPPDEELAGAVLVNPRQPRCLYPFPDLAGVGIALKLALALLEKCDRHVELEALLRIACLGTIADLAPLVGENRTIAALGLRALGASRAPGLQALFRAARLTPPLSAEDVAFRIAPRLNAAGRLSSPDLALELLLTRDARRAADLAGQLEQLNRERQDEERRVCDEARELFTARSPLPPLLVAWSTSWHRGVVGIAAGRLARELNRPVVLLAVEGELATGSGRSAAGIALHEFLSGWRARLVRFGGHAQAVGLAARTDALALLREEWQAAAAAWNDALLEREHRFELRFAPRAVTSALLADLQRLAPHGNGNPQPLTRVGPLRVEDVSASFGRGHVRARAVDLEGGPPLDLLGWGWSDRTEDLRRAREALGYLEVDRYRAAPMLRLVAVRGEAVPAVAPSRAVEDPTTI